MATGDTHTHHLKACSSWQESQGAPGNPRSARVPNGRIVKNKLEGQYTGNQLENIRNWAGQNRENLGVLKAPKPLSF